MAFTNPILAGEELVRSGIKSGDYESGLDGWRITRDGGAEFNTLSARETIGATDFVVAGDSLTSLLSRKNEGLISYHSRNTTSNTVANAVEQPVSKLNWTVPANRMVRYEMVGGVYTNGPAHAHVSIFVRYELGVGVAAPEPTLASPVLRQAGVFIPGGGYVTSFKIAFYQYETVETNMKTMVTFTQNMPGGQTCAMYGSNNWPAEVSVSDIGDQFPSNGVNYNGGGGVATTFRSFDILPYASRSYKGNGAALPYDNQYMMQGDIGIDGNRRSWAWFDANSTAGGNGLGSLNDMVGATDVDYFEIRLNYPHWYYSTGGNAWLGHHNSNVVTATEQGGGAPQEKMQSWPARNYAQWVDLRGTGIETGARAGTMEGIILGNTPSSSLIDYGYAFGANGISGQAPGLKAGYWK